VTLQADLDLCCGTHIFGRKGGFRTFAAYAKSDKLPEENGRSGQRNGLCSFANAEKVGNEPKVTDAAA
jgi:hypothetical protein